MKGDLYIEICKATWEEKENERRALLMKHKIDRARGMSEEELSNKVFFSVINGLITITHDTKR